MEKLILFVAEQWLLVAALLSCLMLLSFHESRRAGRALTPHELVNLVNQQKALMIDLRDKAEYSKGHILDSQSVPYTKLDKEIERLAADKDQPLVLICKLGQHSSAAGKKLAAMGYGNVHRLKGGIGEWQSLQMPLVKG
ncbi:rhodanese-like domain-containing protein [Spongiibacter sp.]|uniref:rhodanese-like domain-containing protein n=1 Tax=Spongiibacter sp. TaxID=2024860 RepID=UPI00356275E3